jgi:pimeloyl-ACP methyl ester carboxylesterase
MAETEKATVNGVELFYVDRGLGAPVLFVHGSSSDYRIWIDHIGIIAPRYRVIAPTLRYCGLSPWPDDGKSFSIQTHASDLAMFIDTLKLGPIDIVGWSYGAAVCLAAAVAHPEIVKRLFLYEPALATFIPDPLSAQRATDDRLEMIAAAKSTAGQGNVEAAVQLFMDGVNACSGSFQSLPHRVQQMMLDNARMLPLLFTAPPPPKVTCEDLGRIAVPVTVAVGGDSRMFFRACAEWAARCLATARLVTISKARHLWPIQDPKAFSGVVLEFLASESRSHVIAL